GREHVAYASASTPSASAISSFEPTRAMMAERSSVDDARRERLRNRAMVRAPSDRPSIRPSGRIVFVMVGLPARGKTFIARKVARSLSWLGHSTHVFNVGAYRREKLGSQQHHSFFDPQNEPGNLARQELALEALEDMLEWVSNGDVAIYD